MNKEFLDLYQRELQLLNEQAREFAGEYPGIAERLGGLLEDRMDPMIGGLLERNPRATDAEIRQGLSGLKCRCGTHMSILRAVKLAQARLQKKA